MTKNYCNICGTELDRYHFWSVKLQYFNDPSPPISPRYAGDICNDCVLPALNLVLCAQKEEAA